MNFKGLIRKYQTGRVVVVSQENGYNDMDNGGEWVDGDIVETELKRFAIVPLSNEDLKHDEGGHFDDQTRKLYCYKHINKSSKIINIMLDGSKREFKVLSSRNYSDFDIGLEIYYIRRVDRDDKDD